MKKRTLALSLLLLTVFYSIKIQAAPQAAEKPKKPPLPVSSLAIPETLGKIESRFTGTSGRWVVEIQDVHAHRTAQENIAAIIDHLSDIYGIKVVALEGGWSTTTFPQSWGLPSSREKQMLARALLDEDVITGPAYSALLSNLPMQIIGIEDQPLYEKNRAIYLEYLAGKKALASKISSLEDAIEKEKGDVFNPELLAFDKSLTAFLQPAEETGKQTEKFIPLLIQKADALKISLDSLDQILLFKKITSLEKSLDKTKLQSEASRLLKTFKYENLHFEELLRSGKVSEEKLSHYPETQKYAALMGLQDKLDHHAFFDQIFQAVAFVKEKLILSETEKALDEKAQRFLILKKILLLSASPAELAVYGNNGDQINKQAQADRLEEALALAIRFYDAARERDRIFAEKIFSEPDLQGNIAVVAGGFHKAGLTEFFRQKNVSHIVVTPDLAGESADEKLYERRLQDTVAAQTLSDMQNRFLTQNFDSAFVHGVKALKKIPDIQKAVELIVSFIREGSAQRALNTSVSGEVSTGTIKAEDFLKFPKSKQLAITRAWLRKAKGGTLPIVIAARTSTFQKLLKDKLGATVWEKVIAPERANTLGDLQDSEIYLTEMIGIKAKTIRVKLENGDVTSVIHSKFAAAIAEKNIAVIDSGYNAKDALLLPENPVSLLLARLILEHHIVDVPTPEFVSVLKELVGEILFTAQSIKQSA